MTCCVYCGENVDVKNFCCLSCGREIPIYLKNPVILKKEKHFIK